ncbi:MAG: helix-turn-helix domain-containing protein [Patescibacteria group bacterium]
MIKSNPVAENEKDKELIRLSVSEAAKLFGVNSQTIRRALTKKEIAYVVVTGRYKINFDSLVKWSQMKSTVKNKTNKRGIGQYVDKWKITNTLFSPSVKRIKPEIDEKDGENTKTAPPEDIIQNSDKI